MLINNKTIEQLQVVLPEFRNTTVLITGSTGMIGQNVVSILLKMNDVYNCNIHVIAHARNLEKVKTVFGNFLERKDFEIIIQDVSNIKIDVKVDYIIHTAGVTGGSKQHVDFPVKTISTALISTNRLLEIAVEKKCKGFLYTSSLEIYGNTGCDKSEIFETDGGYIDPVNVRSSYSESKRMCECMCASYTKQYGVPTYIARLTATFGYGVSYTDNRVFAQFARSVIEKNNIVLKTKGETIRNYCDAEDAAKAILFILARGTAGQAYNVANCEAEISIKDMAEKYCTLFPESGIKLEFDLADDISKLGYNLTMKNVLNSEKLLMLGWDPIFSIDDMITRLVDGMRSNI